MLGAELEAVAGALKRPAWRVVHDAIRTYVGQVPGLTGEERRVVRADDGIIVRS